MSAKLIMKQVTKNYGDGDNGVCAEQFESDR